MRARPKNSNDCVMMMQCGLVKRAHYSVMTSNPEVMCGKSCVAWGCVPLVCRKSLTASDIYSADCRLGRNLEIFLVRSSRWAYCVPWDALKHLFFRAARTLFQ
jgi:hypothetical protein